MQNPTEAPGTKHFNRINELVELAEWHLGRAVSNLNQDKKIDFCTQTLIDGIFEALRDINKENGNELLRKCKA